MNFSRLPFTLGQKVFLVKSYYQNDANLGTVRDQFQKVYKVLSADSIYKKIQKIVESFETTGAVPCDMSFEIVVGSRHEDPQVGSYQVVHQEDPGINGFNLYTDDVQAVEEVVYSNHPAMDSDPVLQLTIANIEGGFQEGETQTPPILVEDSETEEDSTDAKQESEESTSQQQPRQHPFACTMCPKSFNSNSSLIIHTRTHTGERPYKCQYCDKSFKQKGARTVHHRRHTGENPFECGLCGKGYKQLINLKCHMKSNHNINDKDLKPDEATTL